METAAGVAACLPGDWRLRVYLVEQRPAEFKRQGAVKGSAVAAFPRIASEWPLSYFCFPHRAFLTVLSEMRKSPRAMFSSQNFFTIPITSNHIEFSDTCMKH